MLRWNNYLNGMPTAAGGFSSMLDEHIESFRFKGFSFCKSMVWRRVFVLRVTDTSEFMWLAIVVDDILYVHSSEDGALLRAFDDHMEARWAGMKHGPLDGFLNFQFLDDPDTNTVTMSCETRIVALMSEFLPHEMERAKFPETPYHPRLSEVCLAESSGPLCDQQRLALRVGMKLAYIAIQVRFEIQQPLFYILRFMSRLIMPLGMEALNHIILYLYGTKELGLVLGGHGQGESVVSALLQSDPQSWQTTPPVVLVGGDADAGHAEAGPSTGGFRVLVGNACVHAKSGKHHGNTVLGASDAEIVELSSAVATIEAHRDGFRQLDARSMLV